MPVDETYQTKIYREQGSERLFIGSGAIVEFENRGSMIDPGETATVLPALNMPEGVKAVTILGGSNCVSASFWLTSCHAGRDVWLTLRGDMTGTFTNASTQVDVSCSGCILLASVGAAISGFEMHTSAASDCGVHLVSPAENVWSIVSEFGDINE